jgi:hypothetical protein
MQASKVHRLNMTRYSQSLLPQSDTRNKRMKFLLKNFSLQWFPDDHSHRRLLTQFFQPGGFGASAGSEDSVPGVPAIATFPR